jgi:hypothetical protein
VQIDVSDGALKNAAEIAIKHFNTKLQSEIAKDPTAGKPFFPVYK